MTPGSVVEVDGLFHQVWATHGTYDKTYTYCGMRVRHANEAQTSWMTCVACLATMMAYNRARARRWEFL